tara:strand:- start:288 stop:398 length:111 start_codon:yes stop_codon:yes gene_type:complete
MEKIVMAKKKIETPNPAQKTTIKINIPKISMPSLIM